MKRKPRKKRPIEKGLPKGYDSKWEYDLHQEILVFLFSNPSAPMPAAKKRKDGTKRSHAEWAEKNKFRWYSVDSLPNKWKEDFNED